MRIFSVSKSGKRFDISLIPFTNASVLSLSTTIAESSVTNELKSKVIEVQGAIENNLNPDEIMHIGNSYRADIKPAKEAGWNTIYYTSENIENEVTTNNLVDVLQLIS